MKLLIIYISVLGLLLMSFTVMISSAKNPEKVIIGEWQELKWEYEKVNKSSNSVNYKIISDEVKSLIGQNLIIHKAETWQFLPDRRVLLKTEDGAKIANWHIKGRGHILQLKYENSNSIENYNITELNEHELVLNFDMNIQAKGIAKLTFKKNI